MVSTMWSVTILLVAVFGRCQAEEFHLTTVDLPTNPAPDSRIIGGSATTIERFPYTVQVMINGQTSCGGSLITRRHVLSAAHCFVDEYNRPVSARLFSIRAGSASINTGGSVHSVSTIVVHEGYNYPVLRDNDVAVLVLSSSVTLSLRVAVASIPNQGAVVPDNSAVIHVGWGRTNPNVNALSPVLNEVTVYTVNLGVCAQRYLLPSLPGGPYPVTNNMICAGVLDVGGRDACQGDSGGPLIYQNVVVGITSWGFGCAEPMFPGVSARVSSYTTWIDQTVRRYNSSPPLRSVDAILLLFSLISFIFVYKN